MIAVLPKAIHFASLPNAATAISVYGSRIPDARIAIVVPSVEVLQAVVLPAFDEVPGDYQPRDFRLTQMRFVWGNGSSAPVYFARNPDTLRGPQHHIAWAHALFLWPAPYREIYDRLLFGLRLDPDPWVAVTPLDERVLYAT